MAQQEFKEFNIVFHYDDIAYYAMTREELLDRVYARSMIRGMLMFNDLDLVDDPWDYSIEKNRNASQTSSSGGTEPNGSGKP